MLNPIILFLAIIFDRIIGELPESIHPTVWIGKLIAFLENIFKSTNCKNKYRDFLFGSLTTFITLLVVGVIAFFVDKCIMLLPFPLNYIIYGFLLSTTIGYKSLFEFCKKPIEYIKNGDLEGARKAVQHIVSRDASKLDKEHVLSAAVESLSENITDSIIGALFYAIFFGLPGAFVYRAINTLDAMIGYKNEKYLWYGKLAARLDDIANFIPSRIAGILLIITAPFYKGDVKKAIYGFLKEANKVPSPNSGYTMATLANALNITLEKIGYYKLGSGKIDVEKSLNAFKAVDYTVVVFLIIYTLIWWIT
ncbi:cobalamin biosynthesis protein B (cbiB) [Methanocaldococcus jannaschii DSM 2661]|uniref:Probable cobalamin biosynthesis protein CobD n=1 Tax=Methanocaldococcus jannaschii (strain ATCC 43067 / DSM 2661 / JAL-1 / JCM 10045 / NBRC 100440) TaxID=243232 RepID=COBD_METJA|nr:adenosylcobinamide-phosphate synthase CbiB [Methanocaldococcus jannaschii]Q58710.1 RecName: Full=Probable cobalamin biosynthesis protein CobD [Methanocaldococcus jannaschii DSM 2661]AAB99321.1 cobalamin biosynthesis protein B (cbiB) [Methanocaldococcus jannaschii DSM 2661]